MKHKETIRDILKIISIVAACAVSVAAFILVLLIGEAEGLPL